MTICELTEALPVCRPLLPGAEAILPYLRRIDSSRLYSNKGPLLSEFEARFAERCGTGLSLSAVSNGTAALECALLASTGGPTTARHLCLVPSFTFAATPIAARRTGWTPHFVDVHADTGMIDPVALRSHPRLAEVGCVIAVGAFGRLPDLTAWARFQDDTDIPVVVDAAASADAAVIGTLPPLGGVPLCLSFHATKPFGIGEGGAVLTDDPALTARIGEIRNFGFGAERLSVSDGLNAKMSEYHAAVGLAQLDHWDAVRNGLMHLVSAFHRGFAGSARPRLWMEGGFVTPYPNLICVHAAERAALARDLAVMGVETRRWWGDGCHAHPAFAALPRDELPATRSLAGRILCLPFLPDMTTQMIAWLARAVDQAMHAQTDRSVEGQ